MAFGAVADVLINDPLVVEQLIVDVGEPLVEVSIGKQEHPRVRNLGVSKFSVRAQVADRLVVADRALVGGSILVVEGHRSIETQRRYWDHHYADVCSANPQWTEAECHAATARFVAPADSHPPHSTGAAVDVIVIDAHGEEVDMGSGLNEPGPLMATAADVTPAARRWRDRLVAAMEAAGFVNYPQEWWHFSYGDRYWAWRTGADAALYGSTSVN